MQAARFVGSIPKNYDQGLGPNIFFDYADDLTRRVTDLAPKSVLELAAGTGIVTRKLRDELASDCELVATDLNLPMLDVAKAKFQPDESVQFKQVDATSLEFDDKSFDAVVCQFGVMFFPNKERSYAEVLRVLKPGGSYVFNVWDSWDANPFAQLAFEVVAKYFPEDPPGFYKVPFAYHDVEEIKRAVATAGFTQVATQSLALTVEISSPEGFARGLVFGNPLHEEIVARRGNPEEICTALAAAIERELGSKMPLRAFIIQASKTE